MDNNLAENAAIVAIDFKKPIKDLRVLRHQKSPLVIKENALAKAEEYKNSWSEMQKAMKGRHAERFNLILDSLPPREFIKAYLDLLEFFVAKRVRNDGNAGKKRDNKLVITVNRRKSS